MKLHELKPTESPRKKRNRVEHGVAAGSGKASGRGHKGQKVCSGGGVRLGFKGGQLSLFRHLPRRGSININRKEYAIISLDQPDKFEDGTEVAPALLVESGVVRNEKSGIKMLGNGSLDKKLTVETREFSASAAEAIDAKDETHEVI